MNGIIELKLKVFREFQLANPTAHLGGSLGLMIRGVDLLRGLSQSDLDVTVDEYDRSSLEKDALELSSDFNDFDFCTRKPVQDNGNYVKMDIRVTPEPSYDKIEFEGFEYNVSKLRDILFWKKKYAQKGVLKHVNDLIAIETGVRPSDIVEDDFPW
jgi:hypothetical protein